MRALTFCFLLLLFPVSSVLAQTSDTLYLNEYELKVSSKADAAFLLVSSYKDASKTYKTENRYYLTGEKESQKYYLLDNSNQSVFMQSTGTHTSWYKSGQMKSQFNYNNGTLEGSHRIWYENGQLNYSTNFAGSKREGETITYFPDGKLKRRELFVNDLLAEGKCFTKAGQDTAYFPRLVQPSFPGGDGELNKFIRKNAKYPKESRKQRIKGLVIIVFMVDESGNLVNPVIARKLSPELDAESLRIVNLMSGSWKPAMEEGKPISYRFTLPIKYAF